MELTNSERNQVADILKRRANDIASFKMEAVRRYERLGSAKVDGPDVRITAELPGSVEMALMREIERLRRLADKIMPPPVIEPEDEGEEE